MLPPHLIEQNYLEAVIGLPANLFYGTGIPAAIIVFNKGKQENTDVLFIDSSKHFETGKNQNKLRDKDIDRIVQFYRKFNAGQYKSGVVEDKYAYAAKFDEIKENEFNLNIPRYVDTFEKEEEIDIRAVQNEIDNLEEELKKVQDEMAGYLKELGM